MSIEIPGPFSLPLSREQFEAALAKGHGRAEMHAAAHGVGGLEDLLLDACLHAKSLDPQCEGSRADWLMEIATAAAGRDAAPTPAAAPAPRAADQSRDRKGATSGVDEAFATRFMDRVGQSEECWDLRQQCDILMRLAQQGRQRARDLLYSLLDRWLDGDDLLSADRIVELDGEAGLQFVTDRVRELADWQARFGEDLDYLRRCVLAEREGRQPEPAYDPETPEERQQARKKRFRAISASDLIRSVETDDPRQKRYWYRSWGTLAAVDDLAQVADRMLKETDADRLAKYLRVFMVPPLPSFDVRLLEFAHHPDKEVRRLAMHVLGKQPHPEVRELALRYARVGENDNSQLQLFRKNYEPGDWQIIKANLRLPSDRLHLHAIFLDLQAIYREFPEADAEEPMRLLYEYDPCSMCRESAVRRLIEQKRAPEWLIEESRRDFDEQTRELANAT